MERKIIKNNEISQKPFLLILLKIFNNIQDELKKLPAFDCQHFLELKGINESYLHKNVAQRLIKKQHEVKLFKDTYDQISTMTKRKTKARRSDAVMKFSMVSDILLTRMKEQLSIKGEAKQAMLGSLLKLKDSFMSWGQKHFLQSKKWAEESNSHSKVTDDYKLKFVFNSLATTYATGQNSRQVSKETKFINQPNNPQHELSSNAEQNSFKMNQKIRKQRHTVNYLHHDRIQRRSTKKYTKNAVTTQFEKKPLQTCTFSQESIKSKEKQGRTREQKHTNFQSEPGYLETKHLKSQENDQSSESPSQSMILASQEQQNKKSAYFQSQNYIKSRKNLENITLFVNVNKNKTKKRISNYLSSTSEVGFSESAFQEMNFLEPTEGYRSRKFLTRKYIPDEPKVTVITAKSEKTLPRRGTVCKTTVPNHPAHYDKKPISKFNKNAPDEIEEIRFERPEILLKKNFTSIKDGNIEEAAVQVKVSQKEGKNVGEFYNQLGLLRTQLKKETDPYCQYRSQFFHQQGILWEQQKRRMQRVLEDRNKQCYFREFQMAYTTSNRDEEAALRSIRQDFANFTFKMNCKPSRGYKLDQAELSKDRQAF